MIPLPWLIFDFWIGITVEAMTVAAIRAAGFPLRGAQFNEEPDHETE